jgi:hypothetical protein
MSYAACMKKLYALASLLVPFLAVLNTIGWAFMAAVVLGGPHV